MNDASTAPAASASPSTQGQTQPPSQQKLLLARYKAVREQSIDLCQPLEIEDFVVQPSADVSPPKWHLAHTTWFFEELILVPGKNYQRYSEDYPLLFNSYYKSAGSHWLQSERGQLSRPTVREVFAYRGHVDDVIEDLLLTETANEETLRILEIGLHHEQQHQELLLMDIKFILGVNPQGPVYFQASLPASAPPNESWLALPTGVNEIGHIGESFAFDNESPRHSTFISPTEISSSLVSNAQYLEFINAGGYREPQHWLSMGWDWLQSSGVEHPLYWHNAGGQWQEYTLHGSVALQPDAPVAHISYFEAQAYASWRNARLPTEQELEIFLCLSAQANHAATETPNKTFHATDCNQPDGQLWCWTSSAYAAYPGYTPYAGMLGEYNGKFMCNQLVLRGGCIGTPKSHYRSSYRNFYLPQQRWMFSGLRLARNLT